MKICDAGFDDITEVSIKTRVESNYPYNKPDEGVLVLEGKFIVFNRA